MPAPVRAAVELAIAGLPGRDAAGTKIRTVSRVGGGCISPGARVETGGGSAYFVKWAAPGEAPPRFFEEEARSLRALAQVGRVRVPAVISAGSDWLLLEWLEPGPAADGAWAELGQGLAGMHRAGADAFGWPADNWIGSLPQSNVAADGWPGFWRDRRIGPQWERARSGGFFDASDQRAMDALALRLDDLLEAGERDGPSLLHGDLWSGNVHMLGGGGAALIDPSSYHGHREVDLAMARLFGGFGRDFFEAYEDAWPLEPGFAAIRCGIYQLYYLLVHVNLFGAGYVGRCRSVLGRFA